MSKTLIIAEKPNVACKIGACGRKILGDFYLPDGTLLTSSYLSKNDKKVIGLVSRSKKLENDKYIIMYAAGHLIELYQAYDYDSSYKNWSNIPSNFIPNPFKMKVKKDGEDLFNTLKKAMNSNEVNEIIIATDGDREGQSIFEFIYNFAGCKKKCKRIWTSSFTEGALEKAFKEMKDNKEYVGVANAGNARVKSDFLMGALLTAKTTTKLSGNREILTVGRVQTAVLAEIVRIENLINNFTKTKSYVLVGKFKTKDGEIYEGTYKEKFDSLEKAEKLLEQLKNNKGTIVETTREDVKIFCPPLFDQTNLAIEMASKYGLSADETLKACQTLYENGYQTYPRTASRYIKTDETTDFKNMLNEINVINPLSKKYAFNPNNKKIVDDSKVDSHSAITPTVNVPDLKSLNKNEKDVYNEVVLRTIAVNFPCAIDEKQSIITNIKDIPFSSTGKIEKERGFREVYNSPIVDNSLPIVKEKDQVEVLEITTKEVETKPPKRYTEATILKFMETCGKNIEDENARELLKNKGIGTSATRGEIIKKLKSCGYIIPKGKTLFPTQKGIDLINIFPCDKLKNPEFTGELEYQLYKVEKNEISLSSYMKFIEDLYIDSCNQIENSKNQKIGKEEVKSLGVCPSCKKGSITHRKGKSKKGSYDFYGCTNWKDGCKFNIGQICGKMLTENQVKTLLDKKEVGPIKGFKKKDGTVLNPAKVILKNDKEITLSWEK